LFIREYNEEGVSLIDDLQVYPVQVTEKSDRTLKIARRINKITDTSEIQWVYGHDFHLFAIIHSQDTLGQMVDRVLLKMDEIVTSIKKGSRISSHVEDTEKLKDEIDVVLEKPIRTRMVKGGDVKYPRSQIFDYLIETDRRKIQAEIIRDLKTDQITPDTFRESDRGITSVKIPKKINKDSIKASIKEIQDDNWLYE
jgi:sugar-specific transcriptional regulator TrmB